MHHLDFITLSLPDNDGISEFGVLTYRSFCLHNLAVKKGKFIACSCHLIIFIKLYAKYYTYHSCIEKQILFYNYEYDYVVGNGTMVCVDWWRFHCTGTIHLGLSTNAVQ